jgi:hypothetical protein
LTDPGSKELPLPPEAADGRDASGFARAVTQLVERIRPLLAGKDPEVQGCALNDLVAIWVAGHGVWDDPAETARLREELIDMHAAQVRDERE